MKYSLLALTAVFGMVFQAAAIPLNIVNPSFEDLSLSDNQVQYNVPGWTITGSAGTYNSNSFQYTQPVPDGENTAFVDSGSLTQTLDAELEDETYTLLAHVGDRTFISFPGWSIQLLADNNVIATLDHTMQDGPANGEFVEVSLSYSPESGDPLIGTNLGIRLVSSGPQTNFDNVRLVTSSPAEIPEPAAFSLLLFGGLAAFRRRRPIT